MLTGNFSVGNKHVRRVKLAYNKIILRDCTRMHSYEIENSRRHIIRHELKRDSANSDSNQRAPIIGMIYGSQQNIQQKCIMHAMLECRIFNNCIWDDSHVQQQEPNYVFYALMENSCATERGFEFQYLQQITKEEFVHIQNRGLL